MKKFLPLIILVAVAGFVVLLSAQSSNSSDQVATSASPEITQETEPETEFVAPSDPQAALAWRALMDPTGEYAAFAMYSAVIDEFGAVEPYVSIRDAEQRHIDALIRQLTRYGVTVPENPYLGTVSAPADLTSAAQAWAVGEVENVELYDELLAQTTDANLIKVFNNLKNASQDMHLPMFELAAQNGGVLTADQMTHFMHG